MQNQNKREFEKYIFSQNTMSVCATRKQLS